MEMECTVDLVLRKCITMHGVVAETRMIDIDFVTKHKNYQTREMGGFGLDPEAISDYAVCMRAGHIFPELLLAEEPNGRLVVICGWHRLSALRLAGITKFRSLVVIAGYDPAAMRAISVSDNNHHGVRQSNAAGVLVAAKEIFDMPLPSGSYEQSYAVIKAESERYQRNPGSVKKMYYQLLATKALLKQGLNVKSFRMGGVLEKLWANFGNTPAFLPIAQAAFHAGSTAGVEKILDQAKKNKTPHEEIPGLILDFHPVVISAAADPIKKTIAAAGVLRRAIGRLATATVSDRKKNDIIDALNACNLICNEWLGAV